jgi:hypothetical protein
METRRVSTVLGCGCAVVIAFFLAAVLTLTWGTYRAGKDFERVARDPAAAAERARQVVEFGELPEGYRAFGAFSVPLLLEVAFFMSPPEEVAGGDPETPPDRGFLYIKLRDWMGRGDELREALGGSGADDAPLAQQGLDFDPSEVVARGRLVSGRAQVQWLARRGNVRVDPEAFGGGEDREPAEGEADEGGPVAGEGAAGDAARSEAAQVERAVGLAADEVARATAGESTPGILSILAFDCPGEDSWHRLGVWFAPDPAPERPADEVDWSGGPGDPAAIADFLGRFELCG